MTKNCKSILLLVSLFSLLLLFLSHSEMVVDEIISYTRLFYFNVFPTSFLFLLISYLLIENHLFFYLQHFLPNKNLYFFILSILSGYPAGAIYIKESYIRGEIDLEEANQFIRFAHAPNPLFVIYHCHQLFKDSFMPYLFYGIILISQFILYLFTPKKKSFFSSSVSSVSFSQTFQNAFMKTVHTILIIYGTSVFFYILSSFLTHYFSFSNTLYVFLCGVFDIMNGIHSSYIIQNLYLRMILLYFFIVFGSIPIHIQIKSILADTSISYHSFIKGRFISLLLCILLAIMIINGCITIGIGFSNRKVFLLLY